MEVALTALMVALLGYQVTMPSNENAKYMFSVYQDTIVKMNTQDGSMVRCKPDLTCEEFKTEVEQTNK
jgi:DNA recombination-dependent growth factor C